MGGVTGQIIPQMPQLVSGEDHVQKIDGSALEAASRDTIQSQQQLADLTKHLGAGQKGSSRRRHKKRKTIRKRKYMKGGLGNVTPLNLPTAKSIPGIDATQVHKDLIDIRNQNLANASGDKLANSPAMILGGKRRSRKAKNGHRRHRTHRRNHK